MKTTILTMTAAASIIIFSGCATQKDIMVQQGHTLAYAEGFDDGCHSGRKAGGNMFEAFKKDEDQFSRHRKYAQGWSDGFRQCENEQESMDRQIRMSVERQQLNAEREHYKQVDDYHLMDNTNFSSDFERNLRRSQR